MLLSPLPTDYFCQGCHGCQGYLYCYPIFYLHGCIGLLVGIVVKKNNSAKSLTTLTTMTDLFNAGQQCINLSYSQLPAGVPMMVHWQHLKQY
jgi:hypothetical protein